MRIKKLEVLGFKSFLEKASFHFEVPITSIVGPNGCGKSNVVDAIKWVSGELSSKELRGKSMDDLIFAGSELRPPTSMMEVALTLDNSEKLAPVAYQDYPEITVLRRMFRDGTSEFYINKVECRLRDIIDLFLDTGVGESSYSIIEQGRVGSLISSRPEDKRLIIEEAAGITKYKTRRKSAERKMEFTRQNLLRVEDVMGELRRHIGSLERQAKKAEKYKAIRDEVRRLDLQLLIFDYEAIETLLHGLNSEVHAQDELLLNLESQLAQRENEWEERRIALTESERVLEEKQQRLFESRTAVQDIEHRIGLCQRDQVLASDLQEKEKRELLALQELETSLKARVADAQVQRQQLQDQTHGVEADVASASQGSSQAQAKVDDLEQNIHGRKAVLVELASSEGSVKRQLQMGEERLGVLARQIQDKLKRVTDSEEDVRRLDKEVAQKKEELQGARQLRLDLEGQAKNTADRVAELTRDEQATQQSLSDVSQRLHGHTSRYRALEEFTSAYKGYDEAIQSLMSKDARAKLPGLLGLVADGVVSTPGYERAVQAALDAFLQCVVVKDTQSILEGVTYLESLSKGRASFIALEHLVALEASEQTLPEGVSGRVSDFVDQKKFEALPLKAFLAGMTVVESLEQALALWQSGYRRPMVTLKGESIGPWGQVSGGKGRSDRGVLEIKNEMLALEASIAEETQSKTELQAKLESLRSELRVSKEQHAQYVKNLDQQTRNFMDLEREVTRSSEQLVYLNKSLETLRADLARVQEEQSTLQASVVTVKAEYAKLVEQKNQVQAEQDALFVALAEAKTQLSHWFEKVSSLKLTQATIHERLQSLDRDQASATERLESARIQQAKLLESSDQHGAVAKQKADELLHLNSQRQTSIEVFTQCEQDLRNLKSTHDIELAKLSDQEQSLKVLRSEREVALERKNELRLKLQEEQLRKEHIEEQVSQRHDRLVSEVLADTGFIRVGDEVLEDVKRQLSQKRQSLEQLGDVNLGAIDELKEVQERYEFTKAQKEDLEKSLEGLSEAIKQLNATTIEKFSETFRAVDEKFQELFPRLFKGGRAKLMLTNPEDLLESGIDIVAQPPGKKLQNLNLLSGGEKALTAIALIFSIFQFKAPPFCVLDEVDAPLDEANVSRFADMVKEMSARTQFIVITHNKTTMEVAENLYGVTMEEPGVSRLVSVRVSAMADAAKKSASGDGQRAAG